MTRYEILLGKPPPPSSPKTMGEQYVEYVESALLIHFATGEALDRFGLNVGLTRKQGFPDESDFEYRNRITRYVQGF